MFNQVISAFQGLFSRSFWFGSFLPVVITAPLHIIIVEFVFSQPLGIRSLLEAEAGKTVSLLSLFVAGLIILSYALTPMVPLVRSILDGRLLPDWLHDRLRRERMAGWERDRQRLEELRDSLGAFVHLAGRKQQLWKATDEGIAHPDSSDPATVQAAQVAVSRLEREVGASLLAKLATAEAAFDAVDAALRTNPNQSGSQSAKLRDRVIELLERCLAEATYRFDRMVSRTSDALPRPTRIGDARELAECYSKHAYDVNFHYI